MLYEEFLAARTDFLTLIKKSHTLSMADYPPRSPMKKQWSRLTALEQETLLMSVLHAFKYPDSHLADHIIELAKKFLEVSGAESSPDKNKLVLCLAEGLRTFEMSKKSVKGAFPGFYRFFTRDMTVYDGFLRRTSTTKTGVELRVFASGLRVDTSALKAKEVRYMVPLELTEKKVKNRK